MKKTNKKKATGTKNVVAKTHKSKVHQKDQG